MSNETSLTIDQLIGRHLAEIFSEVDDAKRLDALRELYAPDAVLYEPENVVRGIEAISDTVSALLKTLPTGIAFVASGPALEHHGMCCAPWSAGTAEAPGMVTGYDVVQIADGKIQAVYVFLNPPA